MFCVIYKFEVKEGMNQAFISAWEGLTSIIYHHEGSLGSRLHKESESTYIAYAQWPSREIWRNSGNKLPREASEYKAKMYDSCKNSSILNELDMIKDVLRNNVKR